MPHVMKKKKLRDYPDKGRMGLPEGRTGPACTMEISEAMKNTKTFVCGICGQEIVKGASRYIVTSYLTPWITNDLRLMTAGRRAQVSALCSDECRGRLISIVEEGKMSIRDYTVAAHGVGVQFGAYENEWRFDFLENLIDYKFENPQEALEKTLRLVAVDKNIPAIHKDKFSRDMEKLRRTGKG